MLEKILLNYKLNENFDIYFINNMLLLKNEMYILNIYLPSKFFFKNEKDKLIFLFNSKYFFFSV
jgi:hypothetical protein